MPGAVMERPKMTKTMYQALKRHIMRERDKKKQELEQDAMIERRKKEAELRKKKEQEDSLTLEQTKEQISQLEKKLETLKAEKHELFSQLKKVLHQEDETKKRTQMKEQSEVHIIQHHTALGLPHAQHHMSGRPMLYRPQTNPMVQQMGMKRQRSPSPPMTSGVYPQYPESKMIATTMPMAKQQQQQQHPYSHPVPSQADYKQGSYPQGQPVQVTYANQPGHTYQQPAYSKSPGKYNPTSQSAFSSYPGHYAPKQIQDAYSGYPVTRMQQPAGYIPAQHGSNIQSLQQQLEHANQKAGFNEEKYKMQQQGTPIRGVAPMQSQQHMMHQPMQIQQQAASKGSIVTGYSARGQAPPPSSQYQPPSSQPNHSGQQGMPGRPYMGSQLQGRGYC